MVRDALVAIDAGLFARKKEALMGLNRTRALARDVHRLGTMAIATFKRIVRLHPRPFVLGELETMGEKLLARIDCAENFSPHLFRGLHLACNLVGPFVRYMAIGAVGAHARSIVIMDGCFQLVEDIGAHFMTGGAKGFRIRQLQRSIECAPEDNSGDKARQHQKSKAEYRTGTDQNIPNFEGERPRASPKRRPRDFSRRHRVPPGADPLRTVSISTKSFTTGKVRDADHWRLGFPHASPGVTGQALVRMNCDFITFCRMWDDRRLLRIIPGLTHRCVLLRGHGGWWPLLVE